MKGVSGQRRIDAVQRFSQQTAASEALPPRPPSISSGLRSTSYGQASPGALSPGAVSPGPMSPHQSINQSVANHRTVMTTVRRFSTTTTSSTSSSDPRNSDAADAISSSSSQPGGAIYSSGGTSHSESGAVSHPIDSTFRPLGAADFRVKRRPNLALNIPAAAADAALTRSRTPETIMRSPTPETTPPRSRTSRTTPGVASRTPRSQSTPRKPTSTPPTPPLAAAPAPMELLQRQLPRARGVYAPITYETGRDPLPGWKLHSAHSPAASPGIPPPSYSEVRHSRPKTPEMGTVIRRRDKSSHSSPKHEISAPIPAAPNRPAPIFSPSKEAPIYSTPHKPFREPSTETDSSRQPFGTQANRGSYRAATSVSKSAFKTPDGRIVEVVYEPYDPDQASSDSESGASMRSSASSRRRSYNNNNDNESRNSRTKIEDDYSKVELAAAAAVVDSAALDDHLGMVEPPEIESPLESGKKEKKKGSKGFTAKLKQMFTGKHFAKTHKFEPEKSEDPEIDPRFSDKLSRKKYSSLGRWSSADKIDRSKRMDEDVEPSKTQKQRRRSETEALSGAGKRAAKHAKDPHNDFTLEDETLEKFEKIKDSIKLMNAKLGEQLNSGDTRVVNEKLDQFRLEAETVDDAGSFLSLPEQRAAMNRSRSSRELSSIKNGGIESGPDPFGRSVAEKSRDSSNPSDSSSGGRESADGLHRQDSGYATSRKSSIPTEDLVSRGNNNNNNNNNQNLNKPMINALEKPPRLFPDSIGLRSPTASPSDPVPLPRFKSQERKKRMMNSMESLDDLDDDLDAGDDVDGGVVDANATPLEDVVVSAKDLLEEMRLNRRRRGTFQLRDWFVLDDDKLEIPSGADTPTATPTVIHGAYLVADRSRKYALLVEPSSDGAKRRGGGGGGGGLCAADFYAFDAAAPVEELDEALDRMRRFSLPVVGSFVIPAPTMTDLDAEFNAFEYDYPGRRVLVVDASPDRIGTLGGLLAEMGRRREMTTTATARFDILLQLLKLYRATRLWASKEQQSSSSSSSFLDTRSFLQSLDRLLVLFPPSADSFGPKLFVDPATVFPLSPLPDVGGVESQCVIEMAQRVVLGSSSVSSSSSAADGLERRFLEELQRMRRERDFYSRTAALLRAAIHGPSTSKAASVMSASEASAARLGGVGGGVGTRGLTELFDLEESKALASMVNVVMKKSKSSSRSSSGDPRTKRNNPSSARDSEETFELERLVEKAEFLLGWRRRLVRGDVKLLLSYRKLLGL